MAARNGVVSMSAIHVTAAMARAERKACWLARRRLSAASPPAPSCAEAIGDSAATRPMPSRNAGW